MQNRTLLITIFAMMCASTAVGDVVEYDTSDREQWFTDVGGLEMVSTVDFTGYPDFTPVTDQWAYLGVEFFGFVVTSGFDDFVFPNDGWGLRGEPEVNIALDQPVQWIAADYPGAIVIELYSNDTILHTTGTLGGGGFGNFGGVVSDLPFDEVRVFDPFDTIVAIDDLYFGPPINVPGPGVLAPFGLILLTLRRRGRSR